MSSEHENEGMQVEASYRRSTPPVNRPPPTEDPRPEGIDVHPGMDRDYPGPTDPEVFTRPPRPLTPAQQPVYDLPRLTEEAVEAAITPGICQTITEVLDEINRESSLSDISDIILPDITRPPPTYRNVPATSTITSGYVSMAPFSIAGPSRAPTPPPSPAGHGTKPTKKYDRLAEPTRPYHTTGERLRPIPQDSPPLRSPYPLPTPPYYRDYLNPKVRPSYAFICHSSWYVQIENNLAICPECATAEHTFCIYNRPNAVWRQLHVLSRTFVHTDMHCGRCYRLLVKTRRAIDCHHCRTIIIESQGHAEHIVYKILCEAIVPRNNP